MSTARDHGQTQSHELEKTDNILVSDQPPNGASAMTIATNKQPSIPQHVEDHPNNGVVTPGSDDTPPPHLISQSAPLVTKAEPELEDEDAIDTKEAGDGVESEDTDGEEDEEEDEEDDDDDDDDDEPALKYERFGGAFQDLLKKDSASALAVSTRFLALGSHNGFVHILDLTGQRIKTFKPHAASVIDICFDSTAEFIGSASMDGEYLRLDLSPTPNDSTQDRCSPTPFLVPSPTSLIRNAR
jgi:WD40 repeat protein